MPRRAQPSTTLPARVRAYFGLSQAELALYLQVSPELVQAIEAGNRALTSAVLLALLPLARQLPPTDAALTPPAEALPPALPTADAAELDFHRRSCLQQASRIGQEISQIEQKAFVAQHWVQALPALLQATAAPADAPPEAAERATWCAGWFARQARPLPPAVGTRWRLLRARQAALLAEAASLAEPDAV